jgi:hypothetical protein
MAVRVDAGNLRRDEIAEVGVLVAIQDQEEVRFVDRPRCRGLDHVEREGRAAVLRVLGVVEVDLVAVLGDVLQVGPRGWVTAPR